MWYETKAGSPHGCKHSAPGAVAKNAGHSRRGGVRSDLSTTFRARMLGRRYDFVVVTSPQIPLFIMMRSIECIVTHTNVQVVAKFAKINANLQCAKPSHALSHSDSHRGLRRLRTTLRCVCRTEIDTKRFSMAVRGVYLASRV